MDYEFISCKVVICNKLGLHARAAARLVNTANRFKSEILIGQTEEGLVDAKSILAVMLLAAKKGTELILKAQGLDAINNKFDEGQ